MKNAKSLITNPEINRKILHLLFAAYPICLSLIKSSLLICLINLIFCLSIIIGDFATKKFKTGIEKFLYRSIELSGQKKFSGAFWIAMSCLIITNNFVEKNVYIPAMLVIAFCDTFSSLIGKNFGKNKVVTTNKTWEGFAGFLIGGVLTYFICVLCGLNISLTIFTICIILCGIVELFVKFDDNITISLTYCICYKILHFIFINFLNF